MNIEISIKHKISDIDIVEWNEFIFDTSEYEKIQYSIGNNPVMATILSDFFNAKPCYIIIKENKKIVAVIQGCLKKNTFYSLPIFSSSGIYTKTAIKRMEYYSELMKIYKHYQIRDFFSFSPYIDSHKLTYCLNLKKSIEEQFSFYKSKLRNQILKSQSNGLRLINQKKGNLNLFYNIYSRNMHRLGVPVMPKLFFEKLTEDYRNGFANIFIVEYNGIFVGTSLTLNYGEFFEVGWASTINNYNYLNTNMFLYNEMINFAIKSNMKVFSFGRCTENSSTYQFKKQWQGEFHRIYYNYSDPKKDIQKDLTLLRKLYCKMPFFFVHNISSLLRKQLINHT